MKLTVNYYRGARTVDIPITPVTLLAGMNGHGKSSVADAMASLLTGRALPQWMKKKDAGQFVNADSGAGRITLTTDAGDTTITYPDCTVTSTGRAPQASMVAAGIESPLDLSDRDRAQYLVALLKTLPSEQALRDAVKDAGLSDKAFADLWKQVTISGWDAAYASAREQGSQSKGAWMNVTGQQYGSQKGEAWRPAGWTGNHDRMRLDGLDAQLKALRAERDEAMKRTAVDEHELASLRSMAEGHDEAVKMLDEATAAYNSAKAALTEKRKQVPAILSLDDQPCPSCGAALSIKAGKIVPGGTVTDKQVEASRKAAAKHADEVEKLEVDEHEARAAVDKARQLVMECNSSINQLAAMPAASPAGRSVDEINQDIESAQINRDMVKCNEDAAKYHREIQRMAVVVTALAPEGLRQQSLMSSLAGFNGKMQSVTDAARWGRVSLSDDLGVTYDGRDYRLLSQSEKFRVRVTLQLTIAEIDGSEAVVIDAADVLDKAGRNGLIMAVLATGLPALVCMTMNARGDMPDMSNPRIGGLSAWIEAGVTA